jgi:hypothetical protein
MISEILELRDLPTQLSPSAEDSAIPFLCFRLPECPGSLGKTVILPQ